MGGTSMVVIKDHTQGLVMTLVFTDDHKATVSDRFDEPDVLLSRLQAHPEFRGLTMLSELTPSHFRALIRLHMGLVAELTPEKRKTPTHPVMRSLNILLIGLLVCLERRMEGSITTLVVNRTESAVLFDLNCSLDEVEAIKPASKPAFRIVLDRT